MFNFIAQITKLAITQILTLYTPAWFSEILNRYYKNAITKLYENNNLHTVEVGTQYTKALLGGL